MLKLENCFNSQFASAPVAVTKAGKWQRLAAYLYILCKCTCFVVEGVLRWIIDYLVNCFCYRCFIFPYPCLLVGEDWKKNEVLFDSCQNFTLFYGDLKLFILLCLKCWVICFQICSVVVYVLEVQGSEFIFIFVGFFVLNVFCCLAS